jgi:hypothetical protein
VETITFYITTSQPQGATWKPMTGPRGTSKTNRIMPHVKFQMLHVSSTYPSIVPSQSPADVIPCHVSPIDWSNCTYHAPSPATCHLQELPCHMYDRTTCTISLPRGTVRTVQSSPFFSYLGFRKECDIFHIRSPFDEVHIWPESGR